MVFFQSIIYQLFLANIWELRSLQKAARNSISPYLLHPESEKCRSNWYIFLFQSLKMQILLVRPIRKIALFLERVGFAGLPVFQGRAIGEFFTRTHVCTFH